MIYYSALYPIGRVISLAIYGELEIVSLSAILVFAIFRLEQKSIPIQSNFVERNISDVFAFVSPLAIKRHMKYVRDIRSVSIDMQFNGVYEYAVLDENFEGHFFILFDAPERIFAMRIFAVKIY